MSAKNTPSKWVKAAQEEAHRCRLIDPLGREWVYLSVDGRFIIWKNDAVSKPIAVMAIDVGIMMLEGTNARLKFGNLSGEWMVALAKTE